VPRLRSGDLELIRKNLIDALDYGAQREDNLIATAALKRPTDPARTLAFSGWSFNAGHSVITAHNLMFIEAVRHTAWLHRYLGDDERSKATRALKPGQAFLVPVPSQTAYGLRSSQSWEWIWFTFRGELAFEITDFIVGNRGHRLPIPRNSVPMRYLSELYDDHLHHRIVSEYVQAARLYSFLMELCDLLIEGDPSLPGSIRRAMRIIETGYADPEMNVSSLAEAVGLSRYHFSRQFKEVTGETPCKALRARRMRAALERIQTGFEPLRRIAQEVGFRNYSYFSAVFHEFYGSTPAETREQQTGHREET
jgi:AraC-like DNA-binding protein